MTDETVRLTYSELARARGVSLGAARRMVNRHKWPKQIGNDGKSRIIVPTTFLGQESDVPEDVDTDVSIPELRVVALDEALSAFREVTIDVAKDVSKDVIATLQDAIISLRVQLFAERERADKAEKRVKELEVRRWWQRRA